MKERFEMQDKSFENIEGLSWRVSLTILLGVGWLIFLIIWLAFFASGYTGYQNFAIFLVSILVLGGILGIPWTIYGFKHRDAKDKEMWKFPGFKLRVYMSGIIFFIFLFVFIYWLWFYASDYSGWQNIAIFLVLLIGFAGIMGASWASWGIKYGHKFDDKGNKQC
jgi:hypothetical protein